VDISEADDDVIAISDSPPPAKKAKSSSYFSQSSRPTAVPTPMTSRDPTPAVPPPRRIPSASRSRGPNQVLEAFRLTTSTRTGPSQSGAAFDSFEVPDAGPSSASAFTQRTPEQQALHEQWQRRLLERPGGLIPRRRSLALDEAAAAEARAEIDEDGEDRAENGRGEDGSEEEKQKVAEEIGNKLAAKYSAGANGKGKPPPKSKKKKEEVGPSGQTYTPLEKQYMEVKAANPDVLLLMEGRFGSQSMLIRSGLQVQVRLKGLGLADERFHGEDAKVCSYHNAMSDP
jgi:DNA mismatch repair protein MSH3